MKNKQENIINSQEENNILTADDIYTSTETVLKYLDGKEKVRTRAFGQVRWNQCMTFLKYTMPPAKIKAYCDAVNTKRGVAENPAHEEYVSPESFGSTVHQEACEEVMDQIQRGKDRPEDYATLIALRNMDKQQPVNKKQLTLEKERILQDENFKLLAKEENMQVLKDLVIKQGKSDYTTQAEILKGMRNPQELNIQQ